MEIRVEQEAAYKRHGPSRHIEEYYRRAAQKFGRWITRDRSGRLYAAPGDRNFWVRVADAEEFASECLQSKLSDLRPGLLAGGATLQPHEFLFLRPSRPRAESLHGAVTDTTRYSGVNRAVVQDIQIQLKSGLFERYSDRSEPSFEGIDPHSLRHLQNTELFRQGLADTIITKRFNRRSVAQSYAYDHRTLSEHLDAMDTPPESAELLEPKAREAWNLIRMGRIAGPVVNQFLEIQQKDGDAAAFSFLNAEASALHATPYGFCLNSFAVSPCPKHLECFNGCGHLVRSDDEDETRRLAELEERLAAYIARAKERPSASPGFANQLLHAEARRAGVIAALAQKPGGYVFPSGEDRHLPYPPAHSVGALRDG